MATIDRTLSVKRGAGGVSYARCTQRVSFVFTDNATVKAQASLPAGANRISIDVETPTTLTGTPTGALFRCGTTDTGQQIVADVDGKTQGHIAATIVSTYDRASPLASKTTLYAQVVVAGGTSPAGTVYGFIHYDAPVF